MGSLIETAEALIEEFGRRFDQHPVLPRVMPKPDVLAEKGKLVELTLIAVPDEHQGHGHMRTALRMLTDLCDEAAFSITLIARPMGEGSSWCPPQIKGCSARRTSDELRAIYEKNGFRVLYEEPERDGNVYHMIREPRSNAPSA